MRNYYYFDGHKFEQQELRLMMDAVVSAQVITETEKENIIKKIKTLTSKSTAESLQNQIHINKSASSTNQEVKYHISKLHEAIHDEKIINFTYGRYDLNKEFILSKKGEARKLKPYALHWNNDHYYLIGMNDEDHIIHLRVDRLKSVEITEEPFTRDQH